ncbi:hypothetical protein DL89DRAFT_270072 [Linderina pennispora]|uniref:Uncharacterized protein n=1 Tax=Linderina pennispora TaxID=61395 RepID=A0A1Y1W0A2_9FUNG|nr:uncharacterized protein DL89DRAFT_270072 [Linderina pennispora]ORX66534.1 hypothetical protein DL89DRAFT_270072 [Linderina pennispora]
MLLMPVSDETRYYPEMDYPELSMAAAAGHSQLVRSVYLFLSLDHIVDGISTTMLKAGALSAAIFPNVTELVLYFNRSNVFIQGK